MMFTKLAAVAVVLSAGVLMGASNPSSTTKMQGVAGAAKVTICHFDGHDGDFVTFNSATNPAGNPQCSDEGGNAITVAPAACWNGHKAAARYRIGPPGGAVVLTCDEGDSQYDGPPVP